jgi:hypothetical protein
MTQRHSDLVLVLEVVRIEEHVRPGWQRWRGRRRQDRKALARAFVAKALYNEPTTKSFIERLRSDETLRRICGWERRNQIPSESTFSRAFSEFAATGLADEVHKACVKGYLGDEVVWHVSRDSTEVEAREKPVVKAKKEKSRGRRGRPRKGEERPKPEPKRLERQRGQNISEAICELPVVCDIGAKVDSKGNKHYWIGYKLHADVGDGCIPLSVLTTSASVHDSQVAIPLARMTAERVESWYDLMDSAYDAAQIKEVSHELGHVPIIDPAPHRHIKAVPLEPHRKDRYKARSTIERFNSRLKDGCGGRMVRVRGKPKVHAHLMFGVLVIFAQALLSLPH